MKHLGLGLTSIVRVGSSLNYIINWGFWSLEDSENYYASLDDDSPIYSITEKE